MISVAATSYGMCSVAFLSSGLYLILRSTWRTHWVLAGCSAVTSAWSAMVVWITLGGAPWALQQVESARSSAWIAFLLLQLLEQGRKQWLALGLPLALLACQLLLPTNAGAVMRLLVAVLGMLLVERLYRDTVPGERWRSKFLCLGIGALFAYDFYLYSDGLLLRHLSPDLWSARGAVNALCVPLLVIACQRNAPPAPGLSLSRRLLLGSVTLLGSSIYLLAMAASAWYLRSVGGEWGPLMQLVSLAGAVLLLCVALFSGTLRARIKVLINKHFYRGSFDYREEWMRLTRSLSNAGQALPAQTIKALAALVESPAGTLWLKSASAGYTPVARWNMPALPAITSGDAAWCRFMEVRQWVVDIPECRNFSRRYEGLALPAWMLALPDVWLLVPLILQGELFGIVCLCRSRSPMALNWEVIDLLKIAGSQAASYLAYRQSEDSLSVARQFERFNHMSAFVVHDVKNIVSQLSLMVMNAEKHQADPAFQADMLETVRHSVVKMQQLLGRMNQQALEPGGGIVSLAELLTALVAGFSAFEPAPSLTCRDATVQVWADRQRLERVLGHIIRNGIEATPASGSVQVTLASETSHAVIEICDTGEGMDEQFVRERLFKPFESTKIAGMGIGMFESRDYIEELGGSLAVHSAPQQGTSFVIRLPLYGVAEVVAHG